MKAQPPGREDGLRPMQRADALDVVEHRFPNGGPPKLQRAKSLVYEEHRVPQANEARPYGLQRVNALSGQLNQGQARQVYFKARKVKILDTVKPHEWEQADPNSSVYASSRDAAAIEAASKRAQKDLLSKMHWALQVGEDDEEQTYELQVDSSSSSMISAVVGKWTKKEWKQQPSWAKKKEPVGYTTLSDNELKQAGSYPLSRHGWELA